MAAYDKYSLLNSDKLTQPIEMQLCKKQKALFELLSQFLKSRLIFEFFEKRMNLPLMYWQNYGLRKASLGKCLRRLDSEQSTKSNMVNDSKHCWNLDESNFIIFTDQCKQNWAGKSLS